MARGGFDADIELARAAAALGVDVGAQERGALVAWLDELLRWNARVNLTSLTRRDEALEGHVVDALAALASAERASAAVRGGGALSGALLTPGALSGALLDVGTGAGVPAFMWALLRPGLRVVAADAVAKKIAFVRHVARAAKLDVAGEGGARLTGWHGRVGPDEAPPPGAPFDLVTARAVTGPDGLAEIAAGVLRPGGLLLALLGREVPEEDALRASIGAAYDAIAIDRYVLPGTGARRAVAAMRRAA